MNTEKLIARFEEEMSKVQRPGMEDLMAYIRKSDFYTAPASTQFHLSCDGGLLQHSLNVLDALRNNVLHPTPVGEPFVWEYRVAGKVVTTLSDESVIIIALLHDICKTNFYKKTTRNQKNEQTGKWEKVPFYKVNDRIPLGHGDKSAMIIKQYIKLSTQEMFAIWHHMGFSDGGDSRTVSAAITLYPAIWALHTADVMASNFMEGEDGNKEAFADDEPQSAADWANANTADEDPGFQEAPAYATD